MSDNRATEDLLRNYPKLNRVLGWCGLATIILGYVATALGKVSELKQYLFEFFGAHNLLSIHFGMVVVIVVLFIVGYLTTYLWLYRRYLSRLEPWKRRLYSAVTTACALLFAGISIYAALPPAPDVGEFLAKESRSLERELLELRVDRGGLRYNRVDHSVEPQVWLTAQSLVAVLTNSMVLLSETDAKQVREHLD